MFPSDHVIANEKAIGATIERGAEIAARGENIVVLGIRPNRAETGYGYIEAEALPVAARCACAVSQRSPTRKKLPLFGRREIISGTVECSCGALATLANALRDIFRKPRPCWKRLLQPSAPRKFAASLRRLYPNCENISTRLRSSGTAVGQG